MIYHQNFFGGAAARDALVSSSLLLHVRTARPTSSYSPRCHHAMLFLDFTLSVIDSVANGRDKKSGAFYQET